MSSKYTEEDIALMTSEYSKGTSTADIALALEVPEKSVIAKLSALGIYKKKTYLNKLGQVPIKKDEYIDRIAAALHANVELLESLEKVNKNVLKMISEALKEKAS